MRQNCWGRLPAPTAPSTPTTSSSRDYAWAWASTARQSFFVCFWVTFPEGFWFFWKFWSFGYLLGLILVFGRLWWLFEKGCLGCLIGDWLGLVSCVSIDGLAWWFELLWFVLPLLKMTLAETPEIPRVAPETEPNFLLGGRSMQSIWAWCTWKMQRWIFSKWALPHIAATVHRSNAWRRIAGASQGGGLNGGKRVAFLSWEVHWWL